MYNPKFNYTQLERETIDGTRKYATPDGKKLPSVTTILDATKPEEQKRALYEWKKRIGVEKAQQITKQAANRGTKMHTYLEQYVKQGVPPPRRSNPFTWDSHAMAELVIQEGLVKVNEFWGVEVPLYYPEIYAGTTDCVAVHQGQESILDFKQSNKPKKREWIDDYFLQLAAYANAHNRIHGTNIQRGVILMCVAPEMDEQQNIVTPPQYQEFVLEGTEFNRYHDMWWNRVEQYFLKIGYTKP